jgi:3-isopropylmalate dehydrogenase
MRKKLGLYANLRPVKTFKPLFSRSPLKNDRLLDVDFMVVRELTGGIYFGEPRGISENGEKAFDTCVYSTGEIRRIAAVAIDLARKRSGRLCMVDKANVLASSRLWRREMQLLAKENPDIEVEYLFVDNASMQLILRPGQFDVILTENMFGDILTDEASVLPGSIGLLPSASIGNSTAVFEPIHGSFPEGAGKGIANPFGMIRSVALMLDIQFNLKDEAGLIEEAIEEALNQQIGTPDLFPDSPLSTSDAGQWIADYIGKTR